MSSRGNSCARCNWSWWKHRDKNRCPHTPRNPDGSYPKFKRRSK